MIVRNLLKNVSNDMNENEDITSVIYPTTVLKLVLSKPNIQKYLEYFVNMKNMNSNEFIETFNKFKVSSDKTFLENMKKKGIVLNKLLSSNKFYFIEGYLNECSADVRNNIVGPFVNGRELYFYHRTNNIMVAFTYYPIHNLKNENVELSDVLIKEIKAYVFDNVPDYIYSELFNLDTVINYNIEDIYKYNTLTTRYNDNPDDIFKIVKVYNNDYQWEFIKKSDNFTNDVTNEHS